MTPEQRLLRALKQAESRAVIRTGSDDGLTRAEKNGKLAVIHDLKAAMELCPRCGRGGECQCP